MKQISMVNNLISNIVRPDHFEPSQSPVYQANQIFVKSTPENIWSGLVRIDEWPKINDAISDIEVIGQYNYVLMAGTVFRWTVLKRVYKAKVVEFLPFERLAWIAEMNGGLIYQAWLVIPESSGSRLITEQTKHGWLCRIEHLLRPRKCYFTTQNWLRKLKFQAELQDRSIKKI